MRYTLYFLLCVLWMQGVTCSAQGDDEMKKLLDSATPQETEYTYATFKATRVINGASIENIAGRHLDVRISHRFGQLNQGVYDIFGLDNATIRIGADYGITDWLMVGLGRSTLQKTYDGFIKAKLLRQSKGKRKMPLSLSVLSNLAITSMKFPREHENNFFTSRMYYTFQLIMARKLNPWVSVQLSPTLIHRNLVPRTIDQHDVGALGLSGRVKLTRRVAMNLEYFWILPGQTAKDFTPSLSVGFDIETGGHVFQLHFTNSPGMTEKSFIAETRSGWQTGGIHFGFNISRVFSFEKNPNK